jgi:membrane-bound ClpP family serine protease
MHPLKIFLTVCAICCFIGIFGLPIEYYTFLRILVSIGAFLVLYNTLSFKQHYFSIIFLVILILFNPILPIYLYRKSVWIPIDTITGILFLLINFIEKLEQKKEEEITEDTSEHSIQQRAPSRDRIINPKKPKEE